MLLVISKVFECGVIKVIFFPTNVTSWNPPIDMRTFAALKNKHKYHLTREIVLYHGNLEHMKICLEDAAKRMKRPSIGLAFGKFTHLLDATNIIVIVSNKIKQEKLFNCYKKVDIIPSFLIVMFKSLQWKINALMILLLCYVTL